MLLLAGATRLAGAAPAVARAAGALQQVRRRVYDALACRAQSYGLCVCW